MVDHVDSTRSLFLLVRADTDPPDGLKNGSCNGSLMWVRWRSCSAVLRPSSSRNTKHSMKLLDLMSMATVISECPPLLSACMRRLLMVG